MALTKKLAKKKPASRKPLAKKRTAARPGSRIDLIAVKPKKAVPFPFVLDELADVDFHTNPMFGCLAVYVGEKIMFVLRDKRPAEKDNGMWLATTTEHHASLKKDFPSMRSIAVLGDGVTGWQVLPSNDDEFEDSAIRACQFILAGDERIGKIPKPKKRRPKSNAKKK